MKRSIALLLSVFMSSPLPGEWVHTLTNEFGCVARFSLIDQTLPVEEPVHMVVEFENTGEDLLAFQNLPNTVVNGFHLRCRRGKREKECLRTANGEWVLSMCYLGTPWRYPLWLKPRESMRWDCHLNQYLDTTLPGDYSLDMEIPFRVYISVPGGKKGRPEQHFCVSNVTFSITWPTNEVVSYTPPHEDLR